MACAGRRGFWPLDVSCPSETDGPTLELGRFRDGCRHRNRNRDGSWCPQVHPLVEGFFDFLFEGLEVVEKLVLPGIDLFEKAAIRLLFVHGR